MAAGADLLCLPADPKAQRRAAETLAAAIAGGDLSPRRVAEAAGRVTALAEWARQVPAGAPDPALGAAAAQRSLLLDGPVVPLTAPPYVLDAGGRMSRQLEDSAGSLLGVLRTLLPGTDGIRMTEARDATAKEQAQALAAASGRPLVVVVRDAHRSEWQRQLLSRVLAARPDALVVGTGTTHDRTLAGPSYLGTRGSSRASLTAAASLLAGSQRESAQPTTVSGDRRK
jgi:beta-N-acetylhexosaminidase